MSITNYLSFREKTTISFSPAIKNWELWNNINNNILKTSIIYWSNASWKTNFMQAIILIKELIINSHKIWPNEIIEVPWIRLQPFLLNTKTLNKPSEFEVIFEVDWLTYRYNFSLTNKEILYENLYCKKNIREKILFKREKQMIKIYDFDDNNSKNRVNENNLALSVFAKEWSEEAKKINKFFHDIFIFWKWYSLIDTENMLKTENDTFKPFLLNIVKNADKWIHEMNFYTKKIPFNSFPQSDDLARLIRQNWDHIPTDIDTWIRESFHNVYDDNWKIVWAVNLWINAESDWTKKILWLAGSIYNVIRRWKILFIDEINESLHPSLLNSLFMSIHKVTSNNPYQFIFTTHNTHSMNIQRIFRRDQIRFMRKWNEWHSNLTRLSDISVRRDIVAEKRYFENNFWDDFKEKDDLLRKLN